MAALKLTDSGHLARMANGRIIRFNRAGNRLEELRLCDSGYGYWFELVCGKQPDRDQPDE